MKVAEPYLDLKQNPILGELRHHTNEVYPSHLKFILYFLGRGFADIFRSRYNWIVCTEATTASTDFVRSLPDVFICFTNLLDIFKLQGNISHGEFF